MTITGPRFQDLATFRMPKDFRGRSAIVVQLWWIVQGLLFAPSPQFMYAWRNSLLRAFGSKIGKGVIIRPSARITYPWKLTVGDNSWIGDFAEIYNLGEITIGRNAVVSQYCYLCTGSHEMRSSSFDIFAKPIAVEDEAWLAAGVFVHPGVTITKGSVVGARSVVTCNTIPGYVHTGAPAVPIKQRTSRNTTEIL